MAPRRQSCMKPPITGYWAKLERDRETRQVLAWHPLEDHCADVAACFRLLLERTLLGRRLAHLVGWDELTPVHRDRLAFLAALHDLGKCNRGFQNRAQARPTFSAGHVREVCALLGNDRHEAKPRFQDAFPSDELTGWGEGGSSLELFVAAICHHGRPQPLGGSLDPRLWQVIDGRDPVEGVASLVRSARGWFPVAFEPSEPFPDLPAFQHAFSGLMMLADWLGSSRQFFPYREAATEGDRLPFALKRAAAALRWIGLDPEGSRARLGGGKPGFDRILQPGHQPRPVQAVVHELSATTSGSLVVLEAETGAGKTEAALARYLALFHAGRVDGLYFALPTRTAATQLHRRVHQAIARVFDDDEDRPPVSLAVPGYLSVDETEGRRLEHFEVLWPDSDQERFRYRGWAAEHPKRYLAGAIVIGTIDQVLLSALTVSHAHLRGSALLRHLLVVDEVHASDAYMNRILEEVLRFHLEAGGHALLMSATLGSTVRRALLRAAGIESPKLSLRTATAVPFPLVMTGSRGEAARNAEVPAQASVARKTVIVEIRSAAGDPAAVARLALEAAAAGGRILVLRNTVRDCIATQEELERLAAGGRETLLFRAGAPAVPAPHHARFAKEDRQLLDRAIEAAFGKMAADDPPPAPCVTAATQTVQQSLDLDADLLITDLCPMDVLLQRIGRLHRHLRANRPPAFAHARVIVLVPEERDLAPLIRRTGKARGPHGIGTIYPDLAILEATWRLLEAQGEITIPDDNRRLVEATTHPEALEAVVQSRGPKWRAHRDHELGELMAQKLIADGGLLERRLPFTELTFPAGEFDRRILTRLGEGDRLVTFDPPRIGPFGCAVTTLGIPAWACPAEMVPAEAEATEIQDSENEGMTFRLGSVSFHYSRLGLRRVESSSEALPSIGGAQ